MNSTLTYNNANAPWPPLLAQQLEHWHTLATFTLAEVILEQQRDHGHAFRVKVRLEVPEHELRTEASDRTLEGALLLATRNLEHQVQSRKTKPIKT